MRKINGFSLIEILVALGIFTLVLWVVANFQADVFSQNTFIFGSLNADSEMRSAVKKMVAELRGTAQSDTGTYQFTLATKNSLTFFSDIDASGVRSQIRYYLNGTTLERGVIKPTGSPLTYVSANEKITKLVYNIANPNQQIFSYYDENYSGSETALAEPINLPLIRLVKIVLTVDADSKKPPLPLTLESQVVIRSLKY